MRPVFKLPLRQQVLPSLNFSPDSLTRPAPVVDLGEVRQGPFHLFFDPCKVKILDKEQTLWGYHRQIA